MRGVGCFEARARKFVDKLKVQSPCGVWVVSNLCQYQQKSHRCFSPLAGCGLFQLHLRFAKCIIQRFSPLAGCGLFHDKIFSAYSKVNIVSVPLRGVGCFALKYPAKACDLCFSPLAGCGLFLHGNIKLIRKMVRFSPLAGCGLFQQKRATAGRSFYMYQSPCGVWVVSVKMFLLKKNDNKFQSPCGVFLTRCIAYYYSISVSVPLRGVGCFRIYFEILVRKYRFQSPCGVWVVSKEVYDLYEIIPELFQSPCGVWVVS